MNIRYTKVGDLNDQKLKIKGVGYSRQDIIFPMSEFEDRLKKVRAVIRDKNLDAVMLTTPENIFYMSGYQTLGYWYFQALVIPLEEEPFMVLRGLEQPNIDARTYLSHS